MADLTSSVGSSSQTSAQAANQSDLLVQAFKASQQSKIDTLNSKNSALQQKQVFFNSLKTKLDNLITNIDKFTSDDASSKFITRSTTSSNTSVVTATATSDAVLGINSIKVNRLATNDILIGKQLPVGGSDLFGVTGDNMTFKVNGVDVTVSLASGITNENAMKTIVAAINAKSDTNVSASYVKDTSSTGRITLTAKNTGSDNKISFDDNSSGVLNQLGFDNVNPSASDRVATLTGNQYAHYKISAVSNLNAQFEMNGIDMTRGSNTISDVLQGVTLNLLKTQDSSESAVTLTTDTSPGNVEGLINPLLTSYNDLLTYLKSNQPTLRADSAISSLNFKLRATVSQAVTTNNGQTSQYLADIGIKIGTNGTLSIDNHTKLADALKADPTKVSNLFVGTDSFTAKLNTAVSNLLGDNGLIETRKGSLRKQIEDTTAKTKDVTTRIDKQAESLRKEYQNMLQVFMQAQQQYNTLNSSFTTG